MSDMKATIANNRQPEMLSIDYEDMLVEFCFGRGSSTRKFSLPIKAYGTNLGPVSVRVDEDDIKSLCLTECHSLADFEAIRLGIKSFLKDHHTFVVNGIEYRVRREDILSEIAKNVILGERVTKAEDKPSEAA